MKHVFLLLLVQLFSVFTLSSLYFIPTVTAFASGNETDHLGLLEFKKSISGDPYGILLSWNTSTHFCDWSGITCNLKLQRVTQLVLSRYKLEGSISPHIGNLSYMINFNLSVNNINGKIPQELGRLSRLQQLSLGNNLLGGEIPTNLTGCNDLRFLYLQRNNLTGRIPIEIGSLQKLEWLAISTNKLTGEIPSFIGNLTSLTDIDVGGNNFEGHIPQEICHLKNLTFASFGQNKFTGTFPSCLYNMSSLTMISATGNQLSGSLPPNMFHTLPYLQEFYIGENQITGRIPPSITNASAFFLALEASRNSLTGQIPSMGKFQYLDIISLSWNHLGDNSTTDFDFLESLANSSKLKLLSISYNNFGGHLPNSLGNLSPQLDRLYLGGNQISGKIPATIGNLTNLTFLAMENNNLGGNIPTTFVKFQKMQKLNLGSNKLSGELGAHIGNLTQLFDLKLGDNLFEGNIPPSIGNCQKLQYLDISRNNLTGTIPLDLFKLSSLTILLNLSLNSLSGSIPEEVGSLTNLGWLDMSENHMSGEIPPTMGECIMLEYLYLQGNSLQGTIPSSLASLKGLQHLDLSRNQLSGSIPNDLQNISSLKYFNASFNTLEGEVPTKGVFGNVSAILVMGNNKLCGGTSELHLPPCPVKGKKLAKHHKFRLIAVIVSVIVFLLILSITLTIYWTRKRSNKTSLDSHSSETDHQLATVSFQSLHNATDGFSATNLIGSGNFSSVYKGTLEELEEKVVAIKVLDLQRKGAHKSFVSECNALRNIKHRNLIQVLTCCSSIDYNGQEFKALIFPYMTNGSLEQWLHPKTPSAEQKRKLSLDQRLNIMVDVASALHYLHHECEQPIIHCDLKPSNVLLDNEMVPRVSDFGIAKLLSTINDTTSKQTSTIGIKGTIGYIPPEYGVSSEVSTYGDIYSFGILVLEMLTGKSPTDEMFEDGQNLHNFVTVSFPDNLLQILDPLLVPTEEAAPLKGNDWNLDPNVEMCLVSLFRIGISCSMKSPKDRMNISDVTRELNRISVETSK
ncbi:probable LRR receptor-like serine/threonine-protein kinase At3g47570 isoform X2 [Vigna radiata var. radiata]|uniref:non-specific serine/threonine protein kinase n=1 Tax=Vigna radiata var. radiata TaxID=3916 RepID=A0A1S3VM39_VIGRR|nr:probable LRR receptor-like serine/threonine-protein kinase At3g47570 isoform X2 [Vigna radiata var. radiata]